MIDERLTEIEKQKASALNESNKLYENLQADNQALYNKNNELATQYEQTQNDLLDKQLAYRQQEIDKQKENAKSNYNVESAKAKNDYTAFTNPYGYQAEKLAQNGLNNSGLSETTKLGGWNAYQNRLSNANKVYQDAVTQYNSDMNEARLNNDTQRAQNALAKLQMQMQYLNDFYNNKATYSQNQFNANQTIDSNYYNRYQDTVNQINYEKEQAEKQRQYEEQFAYQKQQDEKNYNYKQEQLAYQKWLDEQEMNYKKEQAQQAQANWEKEYALSQQQLAAKSYSSSSGSGSSSSSYSYDLGDSYSSSNNSSTTQIKTNYYTGAINPDTQYGTFGTLDKNGVKYQPDNVGGAKLQKSGMTVSKFIGTTGNTGSTGANIDNQNVWTVNGKYYVWDGSQNKYINITSLKKK